MDFAEKGNSGLAPTREASESIRRALAWLAEEFECSEEEAVRLVCDAAKEVRGELTTADDPVRSLAGVIQEAAALFQVLREVKPGGLPLDELQPTVTRMRLKLLIEKTGGKTPVDDAAISRLLEVSLLLEKEGLLPEQFLEVVGKAKAVANLQRVIDNLGATRERIEDLHELGKYLESVEVPLSKARELVEFLLRLQGLGFDWVNAEAVAIALSRVRKEGDGRARAAKRLLTLAQEDVALQDDLQRLQEAKASIEGQISQLSAELEIWKSHRRDAEAKRDRAAVSVSRMRREVTLLSQHRMSLASQVVAQTKANEAVAAKAIELGELLIKLKSSVQAKSLTLSRLFAISKATPVIAQAVFGDRFSGELLWEIERLCQERRSRSSLAPDQEGQGRLAKIIELGMTLDPNSVLAEIGGVVPLAAVPEKGSSQGGAP